MTGPIFRPTKEGILAAKKRLAARKTRPINEEFLQEQMEIYKLYEDIRTKTNELLQKYTDG